MKYLTDFQFSYVVNTRVNSPLLEIYSEVFNLYCISVIIEGVMAEGLAKKNISINLI